MLEKPFGRVQKIPSDEEMFRVPVANLLDTVAVEVEEDSTWVGEKPQNDVRSSSRK